MHISAHRTDQRVGSSQHIGELGQISQKGKPPEGAGRLALVFPLLAFEDDLLAAGDVGNPLRFAFAEPGLAGFGIDFRPVTDTEMDVVQSLRKSGDVLRGGIVAREHVEVHDDAGGDLGTFDVNENDVFVSDLDGLGSELHVRDVASTEIQGSDVVDIVDLGKIDVRHGFKSLMVNDGVPPRLRVGGGGRRGVHLA